MTLNNPVFKNLWVVSDRRKKAKQKASKEKKITFLHLSFHDIISQPSCLCQLFTASNLNLPKKPVKCICLFLFAFVKFLNNHALISWFCRYLYSVHHSSFIPLSNPEKNCFVFKTLIGLQFYAILCNFRLKYCNVLNSRYAYCTCA